MTASTVNKAEGRKEKGLLRHAQGGIDFRVEVQYDLLSYLFLLAGLESR